MELVKSVGSAKPDRATSSKSVRAVALRNNSEQRSVPPVLSAKKSKLKAGAEAFAGIAFAGDLPKFMSNREKDLQPVTPRFMDLCCGVGGFTLAGLAMKWECAVAVDFCLLLNVWYPRNFKHVFRRLNICLKRSQDMLIEEYNGLDIILFAPSCQPYCLCGVNGARATFGLVSYHAFTAHRATF